MKVKVYLYSLTHVSIASYVEYVHMYIISIRQKTVTPIFVKLVERVKKNLAAPSNNERIMVYSSHLADLKRTKLTYIVHTYVA